MCFTGCCCRCADANDAAVVVAVDTAPADDGVLSVSGFTTLSKFVENASGPVYPHRRQLTYT